ncbi:hypothetical protein GOBAR_DD19283 [Gossypium barbadense]|nr:hypothetical protein GOBAR_DD19283 [Gossypium barbadense]
MASYIYLFSMPDDSNRSHDAREESHASPMDDTGDEFVPNTDNFDIPMSPGLDEAVYFQNLNFMLHHILRAIPRVQPTPFPPPPSIVPQETPIERFHKCKAEGFYGTSEDDLIAAGLVRDGRDGFTARVADMGSILVQVLREVHCRLSRGVSELVRQVKVVERVLSMRLSSLDESSIQSKRVSDTTSLFQIAAKRIWDSRGFKRAPSTQSQRSGQGSRPRARRRPLTSSSLASLGGAGAHQGVIRGSK